MRALAFGLAAVLAFLALATTIRTTDVLTGALEARQVGTATVTSCTEHGPIGRWGVGTSHACEADVRWDGGGTERVAFAPGQLEPGEQDVAVFRSTREAGRNDSARWFLAGPLAAVALGLLALWFLVAAVLSLVPARTAAKKPDDQWPVTKAEVKATPVTRRVRRLRLLAWLALATAAAEGLASMPFFDAPRRAGEFVSPWPAIEDAWLVDLPSGVLAGFAVLVAAVIGLIAESVHKDAARIVRYGQSYLDAKKVPRGGSSWVPSAILAALAVWAVVEVVLAIDDAPVVVWLAGGRDALVLLALLGVVLSTRQSAKDMAAQLVAK
ncbi:DUF6346 domain-containing protein [Lentzea albida]|uniref:SdpI/YhfL protein family protein n=1 Tax=Lentzea albida TaxID=65499 RepID=A0A1H9UFM6_9PSEU|nr:DUF6346 domain-containing protein [Lentzea albida]SES08256.1 hypothetical protein SAMN04488000_115240 [Lentzea albida]